MGCVNLSLDLTEYSNLSQILLTIITFIGIILSMWLSVKALREVQIDRKLRQKPYLVFETGGFRLPIEFVKAGKRIPGINPSFVEKMFADLPDDAESIRLKVIPNNDGIAEPTFYGKLLNCGLGPALATKTTWIPSKIRIGSEEFAIDEKKLSEPLYDKRLNSMPTIPSFILPNESAELSRIPTFIEKDFEKKITMVDGFLQIECKDLAGEVYSFKQLFYIFVKHKSDGESEPYFHVTFRDPI
jgi:hypothetical protein